MKASQLISVIKVNLLLLPVTPVGSHADHKDLFICAAVGNKK